MKWAHRVTTGNRQVGREVKLEIRKELQRMYIYV